jgi:hypothetical protein
LDKFTLIEVLDKFSLVELFDELALVELLDELALVDLFGELARVRRREIVNHVILSFQVKRNSTGGRSRDHRSRDHRSRDHRSRDRDILAEKTSLRPSYEARGDPLYFTH